jgi:hypothetical protein
LLPAAVKYNQYIPATDNQRFYTGKYKGDILEYILSVPIRREHAFAAKAADIQKAQALEKRPLMFMALCVL